MNSTRINSSLAIVASLTFLLGCQTDDVHHALATGGPNSSATELPEGNPPATNVVAQVHGSAFREILLTNQVYHVRAGGPNSFVGMTNTPTSNHVSLLRVSEGLFVFRLINEEAQRILVWNVRVQIHSTGPGTDGFGWETVHDAYPNLTSRLDPGASGKFTVLRPGGSPWWVCLLYSKDWTGGGVRYSGNYEVISQEYDE